MRHRPATLAPSNARRLARATCAAALPLALALTACTQGQPSGGDGAPGVVDDVGQAPAANGDAAGGGGAVTLVTHDSWAASPQVVAEFARQTGYDLQVVMIGDAGTLANQVVLTADHPLGDAVFGIDNTFSSRVENAGAIDGALIPITEGDVCLNVDSEWFTEHGVAEPETFDDLLDPTYNGLTVVLNPASSSPGLAFLLATISNFGPDGWQEYWTQLAANDIAVAESWSDGYYAQFSGAGEDGTRPIVVSYSTSPAFTLTEEGSATTTRALLDTCFRQTEYAGVLAGAANPEAARAAVEFLASPEFQNDIPEQMYMYPAWQHCAFQPDGREVCEDSQVTLPADWAQFAPQATSPHQVEPADIDAHRDEWINEWTRIVIE